MTLAPKLEGPALTKDELETVSELGRQLLSNFDSFTVEDCVRYGKMKSQTLSREKLTAWALGVFVPSMKARGYISEVHNTCYDEAVFSVLPTTGKQ